MYSILGLQMRKVMVVAGLVVSLAGCAGTIDLQEVARGSHLKTETITTPQFNLQALVPRSGTYQHLRVYIEGDGHAWATSSQPSTDPTPTTSLMAHFAAEDRLPAAYLARPCQFVTSAKCSAVVWTSERFSPSVMSAMNAGLDSLKHQFGVQQFELVGHSGGGAVALVLAGMRTDVSQVQTIAGNVDPIFWTKLQNLTPLTTPATPLQYKNQLRNIPQRLFIGLNDTIVPPAVAHAYGAQLEGQCVEVTVTNATHNTGYEQAWSRLSNQPLLCKGQ